MRWLPRARRARRDHLILFAGALAFSAYTFAMIWLGLFASAVFSGCIDVNVVRRP